jgi:hypothetical protein
MKPEETHVAAILMFHVFMFHASPLRFDINRPPAKLSPLTLGSGNA